MLQEFRKYLISECNVVETNRFLVAVSGGVDSVVMAELFKLAGLNFAIAHCNFHLRGEESDADQDFVASLAHRMNVPYFSKDFDTKQYAREKGISVQMAARDLRYAWFLETSVKNNYHFVASGHNKNDVVETMLLNLSRGTGFRGLMGIRARYNNIIRPLLFASRQTIEAYAHEYNIHWREDSSNRQTRYSRNKIRHSIVPAFESINPAFVQNAIDTCRRIEHTGKLLDLALEQIKREIWMALPGKIIIDIEKLKKYPANDILLFELLRDFGVSQLSSEMLINTVETSTGKQFHTRSHTITRDRNHLIVTENISHEFHQILINPDTVLIDHPIQMCFKMAGNGNDKVIPTHRSIAALDADRITWPILLRGWRNGDRFQPLGMKGTKKVSDFLINIKLPLPDKQNVWVLESGGEIAWVVNHRIDERFRVTENTARILFIEFNEGTNPNISDNGNL